MQTPPSAGSVEPAKTRPQGPPARLFIALAALAIITVLGLFSAMARGSATGFVAVICNLLLMLGLLLGHRWAYVLLVLFSIVGIAVAFSKGAGTGLLVLLGNAVVVLPVLGSTSYFFQRGTQNQNRGTS